MPRSIFALLLCLLILVGNIHAEEPKPTEAAKTSATVEKKEKATPAHPTPTTDAKKDVLPSQPSNAPKADAPGAKTEKKDEPYIVKRGPIKVTVTLDGVFEAKKSSEILVKPEEWTSLRVESAAEHGARVRKGDVILTLDTEKIDQAIEDLQTDLKLGNIAIEQCTDQLAAGEKLGPLDLKASQRSVRNSQEDQKYFVEVDRPFETKLADFRFKLAQEALEYDEEELRQLEKMYKADDITEETEQIVLKRARDTVEKSNFVVDMIRLERDQMLKFTLPRMTETINDSTTRTSINWEKAKIEIPLNLRKQQLELQKLRASQEKSEERLKKLKADRDMMIVKSPIDGIVYYGKCVRGRFSDSNSMSDNLRPNGTIMPNQIVMTVVEPRPISITATVPESQLHYLRPGMKGIATPTGYPNLKLSTDIEDISDVPTAPGSFDTELNVTLDRKAKRMMPGMTCKVKMVVYSAKDAIVVLPKYIQTDELDDEKEFVWVLDKDSKPQRRDIKVGEKTGKQVEVLSGLGEGEKLTLEGPKEQK
jgi:multidrug efflux pump subunit AcrA (membrane-fusion protein)